MKLPISLLLVLAATSAQAQLLVSKGAKGTLSVTYDYTAAGKYADVNDSREWRVKRSISLVAQMSAQAQQPMAAMHKMDSQQVAELSNKQEKIASVHKTMQPTMNDMMKIAERCGDDEDCISKAVQAYGNNMQITPEMQKAKADIAEVSKPGAPRYQLWMSTSQTGTYLVDEFYHALLADPLCATRCKRDETRKGGGPIPPPPGGKSTALATQLEVDSVKKDMVVALPIPLGLLVYTTQVVSDYPDQNGTSKGALGSQLSKVKPITVAIPADLRAVSGTEIISMDGVEGEGGKLVVTWQFKLL